MISLCRWRQLVRISTLKCSCLTERTVLASAGSTPWMNSWNTTRRPPSLPANTERSCTWSNRCCDSYFCIHTGSDTHSYTHSLSNSLSLSLPHSPNLSLYTTTKIATPNRLNSSLSLGAFALASVLHPGPQTLLFNTVALCWWSGETFSCSAELASPMMNTVSGETSSCFFVYHTVHKKPLSFVWPRIRLPRRCWGFSAPSDVLHCPLTRTHIVIYTIAHNPYRRTGRTQTSDGLSFRIVDGYFN